MGCNDDYCEVEKPEKIRACPNCGNVPIYKINNLTSWIRCQRCGRCAAAGSLYEAIKLWNGGQDEQGSRPGTR